MFGLVLISGIRLQRSAYRAILGLSSRTIVFPELSAQIELSGDQEFPKTAGMRPGNFSLAALSAPLEKAVLLKMIERVAMTYRLALEA
jgi:hypothetical protein